MEGSIEFPKDFLWGAATSAHQVEGNNLNSDWWEWEQRGGGKEPSLAGCRHYELFPGDFDLAKGLNHNAHRFSVEWARIEPKEGSFAQEELQHYKQVISSLRERGIEPLVTLHHFTNPLWFAAKGGWLSKSAVSDFLRYTEAVAEALADKVHYWMTINEPLIYTYFSYMVGDWPPQEHSVSKSEKAALRLKDAHIEAFRLIKDIYRRKNLTPPMISIAHHMQDYIPCQPTLRNKFASYIREKNINFRLLDIFKRASALDYIGVNYYSRSLVEPRGWGLANIFGDSCDKNHHPCKKNSLGWDIYPEGLYHILKKLKRYNLPIIISENGICTEDDSLRWEFICGHLKAMHRAMQEGADVRGYLYWSLLDNFEWDKGFTPRFGLIGVDYKDSGRTVRESARKFAEVCRSYKLEDGAC